MFDVIKHMMCKLGTDAFFVVQFTSARVSAISQKVIHGHARASKIFAQIKCCCFCAVKKQQHSAFPTYDCTSIALKIAEMHACMLVNAQACMRTT